MSGIKALQRLLEILHKVLSALHPNCHAQRAICNPGSLHMKVAGQRACLLHPSWHALPSVWPQSLELRGLHQPEVYQLCCA